MTTNEIEEIAQNALIMSKTPKRVDAEALYKYLVESLLAYGEKVREEERERIKEVISIEIEAWFGAHDEMEKSFMSEDMIKQIIKRMEEI